MIKDVRRSEQASIVQLRWKNNQQTSTKEVAIRSLDDFAVTEATVLLRDEKGLVLHFSDPLLPNQNLDGLVQISDYTGKLRYLISDNQLRVYPENDLTGERTVTVSSSVKNINANRLNKSSSWNLLFEPLKPQVRLVGEGVILPHTENVLFPFEVMNLKGVKVEVFKIFSNNVHQFLQNSKLDKQYGLERVGRLVRQQKIDLNTLSPTAIHHNQWTRYAFNLKDLIAEDAQAIYQISIGFAPEDATFACPYINQTSNTTHIEPSTSDWSGSMWSNWYGADGYYEGYWNDMDNPCKGAYYNPTHFVRRNVVASNFGIIGKVGQDQSAMAIVTDLRTAQPLIDVKVDFLDYQNQLLATGKTDQNGIVQQKTDRPPFLIVATKDQASGYLTMQEGKPLSVSRFDVAGQRTQKGIKGFIYGERGVWRPGDSLFLNFILEGEQNNLPKNQPITFELTDARGQLQVRRTTSQNVGNIYPLHTATATDATTGNWTAQVKVGGATFTKVLKIETIKPNRLNVDLDFGKTVLSYADEPLMAQMQVNWLHGAPAQNLATKVELVVQAQNTTFKAFSEYEFDDPARKIYTDPKTIFEGNVDAIGRASFSTAIASAKNAPGQLLAKFKTRAFEAGGDFTTSISDYLYHPYAAYAGLYLPENISGQKSITLDKNGIIELASVSKEGTPLANRTLSVGLYKVDWRWWWERGHDNVAHYNSDQHKNALRTERITTDSKGEAQWQLTIENWGRYLVRVCDEVSGHCAGDYFYAGSPWYDNGQQDRDALAMLSFSADQETYEVGETVQLKVPASQVGQALVSIEDGTQVLETFWINTKAGENVIRFKTTTEMSPTAYAHVTLLQPHEQVENDLPLRMYGVIPLNIQDSSTQLSPTLKMADELKPNEEFSITVGEEHGQAMAYTIAMVEEGLLDLTNFKTPHPHAAFYAREALGVQTWDMYSYVLGAKNGALQGIISIGGDTEVEINPDKKQANRFQAVVQHIGPFYLSAGKTATHRLKMPNYIGSVRTMLVAANANKAFGQTAITTPVRNPLMVLGTLPRVLGPSEQLRLPITVFANHPMVKAVTVKVEDSSGLVRFRGQNTQQLTFDSTGEQNADFYLEVGENVGIAKFKLTASGGGFQSEQRVEVDIRNPNPFTTHVQNVVLEGQETHTFNYVPLGIQGTNTAILEVSSLPPLRLQEQLQHLLRYPHGCLEQTTSAAFSQLFLHQLLELDETQRLETPKNIRAAIQRLQQLQLADGGFAYWPNQRQANEWGTNYAGHFLLEAQNKGYSVPNQVLERWKKHQQREARIWQPSSYHRHSDLMQAYRLYTLALANAADLSSMNRLRERKELSNAARWRLAGAYALIGRKEVAQQLLTNASIQVADYQSLSYTYGSGLRDQAMILEILTLLSERTKAATLVQQISEQLNSDRWHSTQEIAYCLLGISKFVGAIPTRTSFNFAYQTTGNDRVEAGSNLSVMTMSLPIQPIQQQVQLENLTDGILFAHLITEGQPLIGKEVTTANDLVLEIDYKTTAGKPIDITRLQQGTDFVAEVRVTNPGTRNIKYEALALSQIFPSGWEVLNNRVNNFGGQKSSLFDYQNIRDEGVYTYFDLAPRTSKVYRVALNASYQGRYYLPAVKCSAMYDASITANTEGTWVEVIAF
ncbi:MAG: MG2 domain-containing protein [Bacteroidota bacterium]